MSCNLSDIATLNKEFIAACGAFYQGRAVADLSAAERLYLLGAEVDSCDEDGWSALFHACGEGHAKVVEWLVEECRADINLQSPEKITPLWIACFNGRRNIVQYLLRVGADERVKASPEGEAMTTPALAARRNRNPGIADMVDVETQLRAEDPTRIESERARMISPETFKRDVLYFLEKTKGGGQEVVVVLATEEEGAGDRRR